jgi:NMD protein affecting ribosome stability and mRNA decay
MEITCCQCGHTITLKQALMQRGRLVSGYCPDCFDVWQRNKKLMAIPYPASIKRLVGCFIEWEIRKHELTEENKEHIANQFGYYTIDTVELAYNVFQKFKKVYGLW